MFARVSKPPVLLPTRIEPDVNDPLPVPPSATAISENSPLTLPPVKLASIVARLSAL